MRDSLGEHSFTATRRSVHEDTSWRIDTNLLVKLKVRERKLNSFSDFLLLGIKATNITVADVRLLVGAEHGDR